MSSILGQIKSENWEFGKIAESAFVYTLVSTNIDQSAPNLVKMYMTIRSRISSIMDVYDLKISNEFDYGSNRTRTVRVISP